MMQNKLDVLSWVVLGIFLMVLVYLLTPTPVERPTQASSWLERQYAPLAGVIYTLAFDINADKSIGVQQLLNGQNYFLVYLPGDTAVTQDSEVTAPFLMFNDAFSLMQFDLNQDGYIDQTDPGFANFYVARFNYNGKTIKVLPLSAMGILAFKVYESYLQAERERQVERLSQQAGEVILADSSRWPLQVVPVDMEHFTQVMTVELPE
jgi:hypothetical protein